LRKDIEKENRKRHKRQLEQNPYAEDENVIELLMTNDVQFFNEYG